MYATKEEFRQYLFSPARQYMSFQQYLIFKTTEGPMDELMEQGRQAVRDLEHLQTCRDRIASVAACMILLQLAIHLDQRAMNTEGSAA